MKWSFGPFIQKSKTILVRFEIIIISKSWTQGDSDDLLQTPVIKVHNLQIET